MHPAIRLITRLWLAIGLVILLTTLAACGGGGDDCHAAIAAPAQRTLSVAAPVGELGYAPIQPAGLANVRVSSTVSLSGAGGPGLMGPHTVLLAMATTRPGEPVRVISQTVELPAGQSQRITLTGQAAPGAQVLSLVYAVVGTRAEGQTLSATDTTFEACEATP